MAGYSLDTVAGSLLSAFWKAAHHPGAQKASGPTASSTGFDLFKAMVA
jgi:hypothetical protein